jgi:CheY-like chemotaxis protein
MSTFRHHRPAEILLVEDSPSDARLFVEALKGSTISHHLTIIDSGREALTFLRREAPFTTAPRPDLTVLDLNLPDLSGREVLTMIRQDAVLQHLVVVMLTSSAAPQDVYTLYRVPVNCFITKPLDLKRFFTVVQTMVEFWLTMAITPEA